MDIAKKSKKNSHFENSRDDSVSPIECIIKVREAELSVNGYD